MPQLIYESLPQPSIDFMFICLCKLFYDKNIFLLEFPNSGNYSWKWIKCKENYDIINKLYFTINLDIILVDRTKLKIYINIKDQIHDLKKKKNMNNEIENWKYY